jgi:hypothetical protein
MSWSYMCSPDYEDTKVIKKFEREIVAPFTIKFKEFRPIANFK